MYVYWWHVRGLRAVKVGHAEEPRQRVSDYRHEFGLGGKDVRVCRLDHGTDAEWVESQLCRLLESHGFRRIALQSEEGEEELFALGGHAFGDVHEILYEGVRHIVLAEIANRRREQRRRELEVAEVPTRRPPEEEAAAGYGETRPWQYPDPEPSRFRGTARPWFYLSGAIVLGSLVTGLAVGLGGADMTLDQVSAKLTELKASFVTTAPPNVEASAAPLPDNSCTLIERSDTLVHVSCIGSWASMRWNGRWILDSGHNERDAVDFFKASTVAQRVVVLPSPEPAPQLPEQAKVKPAERTRIRPVEQTKVKAVEQATVKPAKQVVVEPAEQAAVEPEPLPPSVQPAALPAPAPQPRPRQAPLPAATVHAPPLPQELPAFRQQCSVSRPKPGFQVYLVTCPNSRVTIGRTVNMTSGWMVSESVNGTEAIDFFMRSPYAR